MNYEVNFTCPTCGDRGLYMAQTPVKAVAEVHSYSADDLELNWDWHTGDYTETTFECTRGHTVPGPRSVEEMIAYLNDGDLSYWIGVVMLLDRVPVTEAGSLKRPFTVPYGETFNAGLPRGFVWSYIEGQSGYSINQLLEGYNA